MAQQMKPTRLGLDLGTNSIGWCLLSLDSDGEPDGIVRSGVRIFSDGRKPTNLTTKNADRRLARQQRRRRDRYLQRRRHLMELLVQHGLMPEDEEHRRKLAKVDPYPLRAKALDRHLHPYRTGRALFHLNQRRGFKSNRKTDKSQDGPVKRSVEEFQQKLKERQCRTVGEYLHQLHGERKSVRARRTGTKKTDIYELYPNRAMLEEEFGQIWQSQRRFHPDVFTERAREAIHKTIFHQRPLKKPIVGPCQFMDGKHRAAKALPSFQRFRILQEINNLEWHETGVPKQPLNDEMRSWLEEQMKTKKKVTFKALSSQIKSCGLASSDVEINLEWENRDSLEGNITAQLLASSKGIGKQWHEWPLNKQDDLVALLIGETEDSSKEMLDDDAVREILTGDYGLTEDQAEYCMDRSLPDGHGNLCREAILKIIPHLEEGLIYSEAVEKCGWHHSDHRYKGELLDALPYYGEVLEKHVTNPSRKQEDRKVPAKYYGRIPNPTVHIALGQLQRVINELIRLHGRPTEIVVEVGRDLPLGAKTKNERMQEQKKNRERNQEYGDRLREEFGQDNNRKNRLRLRLWEEMNVNDPQRRVCPYSGRQISTRMLFSDETEIDHILPYSRTLDDGINNKVLCTREANRDKGNKTPHEAFGHSPDGYSWTKIVEWVKGLPVKKRQKFHQDAMKHHEEDGGFLKRQLNDNRYISRITKEYLSYICRDQDIQVIPGRLTAYIRAKWGLNKILDRKAHEHRYPRKNRDDHRHHAVDALVIGLTSRSLLQRMAKAARRSDELEADRLMGELPCPWDGFYKDAEESIQSIIVSHKSSGGLCGKEGQLHEDTAFSIVSGPDDKGNYRLRRRVSLDASFSGNQVNQVVDDQIREVLEDLKNNKGKLDKDGLDAYRRRTGTSSVQLEEEASHSSIVIIRNCAGEPYKAYKTGSNWACEIYQTADGKWHEVIIRRFDANQPGFIPEWRKKHPTAKLVMRLKSDDVVCWEENGAKLFLRVQRITPGQISFADCVEANADKRNRDRGDSFNFTVKSVGRLQKLGARKADISPSGLVSIRSIPDPNADTKV